MTYLVRVRNAIFHLQPNLWHPAFTQWQWLENYAHPSSKTGSFGGGDRNGYRYVICKSDRIRVVWYLRISYCPHFVVIVSAVYLILMHKTSGNSVVPAFVLGKIYSNTMMVNFNHRIRISDGRNDTQITSFVRPPSKPPRVSPEDATTLRNASRVWPYETAPSFLLQPICLSDNQGALIADSLPIVLSHEQYFWRSTTLNRSLVQCFCTMTVSMQTWI